MKEVNVSLDECICDKDGAQDYVDVLNGIAWFCQEEAGYHPGWRNEIAVNLTVSAFMLGLEAIDVLDDFIHVNLIDPSSDDEDTHARVDTILRYTDRFDWSSWMIDPWWWRQRGNEHAGELYTIKFNIS